MLREPRGREQGSFREIFDVFTNLQEARAVWTRWLDARASLSLGSFVQLILGVIIFPTSSLPRPHALAMHHEDRNDQLYAKATHEAEVLIIECGLSHTHQCWCCSMLTWVSTITDSHLAGIFTLLTEGAETHGSKARAPYVTRLMWWGCSSFLLNRIRKFGRKIEEQELQDMYKNCKKPSCWARIRKSTLEWSVPLLKSAALLLLLALAPKRRPAVVLNHNTPSENLQHVSSQKEAWQRAYFRRLRSGEFWAVTHVNSFLSAKSRH